MSNAFLKIREFFSGKSEGNGGIHWNFHPCMVEKHFSLMGGNARADCLFPKELGKASAGSRRNPSAIINRTHFSSKVNVRNAG